MFRGSFGVSPRGVIASLVSVLALVTAVATSASAASPSDDRADFYAGNVVNCSQAGFPDSTTAFANAGGAISVAGGDLTGSTDGTHANVTLTADGVSDGIVVDAVIVKGGPAWNLYADDDVLPPTLGAPQNYISPLNGGSTIPAISHWFVCYHVGEAPPPPPTTPEDGSLLVVKHVVNVGANVTTEPSYAAGVSCDDGTEALLTFPGTGGPANEGPIEGITAGSFCIVTETTSLPVEVVVSYSPTAASGPDGVEIEAGTEVEVTITNDYADARGTTSEVTPPPVVESGAPAGEAPAGGAATAVVITPRFTG